jgi:hypothetical protein
MDIGGTLRLLGVAPARLDPAPSGPLFLSGWQERVGDFPAPCVACGQPARFTGRHDLPGFGRRWVDWCRTCYLTAMAG